MPSLLKRKASKKHTIPTIFRRVYNSCRMRCEANQVNPILFAINCLQTTDGKCVDAHM